MISPNVEIRNLDPPEVRVAAAELGRVLLDCVAGGASVSFMADLSEDQATRFWLSVAAAGDGRCVLASYERGELVGVVEVVPAAAPNQPHRADIAKLLVSRKARRRGIGEALMRRAETEAAAMGRTLLVLDTIAGEAGERLYARLGWTRAGEIPNYALMPNGRPAPTVIFYKDLAG